MFRMQIQCNLDLVTLLVSAKTVTKSNDFIPASPRQQAKRAWAQHFVLKVVFFQVISWGCTTSWYEVKTFEVERLFLLAFVVALEQKPREKDSLAGL